MKYFKKSSYTAEELKKEFRELANHLHPDHGGNAEEFKAMMAEYSTLLATTGTGRKYSSAESTSDYMRRQWEQYQARKKAEEQQQREEDERRKREEAARRREEAAQEAERARKAQEVAAAAVRAWSQKLERIPESITSKRHNEKKSAAAYTAATKRNIKKVVETYFPGCNPTVKITNECWKEEFSVSWEDGPTVQAMKDTAKELQLFIPAFYSCDPYCDYGTYNEDTTTSPWREAFGQAGNHITSLDLTRTLSDEGTAQLEAAAAAIFSHWTTTGEFSITFQEYFRLVKACGYTPNGFHILNYTHEIKNCTDEYEYLTTSDRIMRLMREIYPITTTKKDNPPQFRPNYGPTMKAIKKALGQNIFATQTPNGKGSYDWQPCDWSELCGNMLFSIRICGPYTHDGAKFYAPLYFTNYKAETSRRAKFASCGLDIDGCRITGITADTVAALRAELADIDRQRAEREHKQTNKAEKTNKADTTAPDPDTDAAPAEGLTLEDIPGGVAVTGDPRTTFRNRRAIKAHGATWNKDAQQWQATDPKPSTACAAGLARILQQHPSQNQHPSRSQNPSRNRNQNLSRNQNPSRSQNQNPSRNQSQNPTPILSAYPPG